MARLGLHGRAFIPLLSGYACAIPAILGTRTISSFRDRLVTMLMIPYMSCSARLPIYALIIGAVFVTRRADAWISPAVDQGLVLLGMYALSTVSALVVGFIYKRTLLRSPTPPLVLELPPYRVPRAGNTLRLVYDRTADFVKNAGTVILAFTVVLWAALSFPSDETGAGTGGPTAIERSYGGRAAKTIEPALEPIGQDWRVGIGILGSFAAREVLVSTLGLAYGMEAADDDPQKLSDAMREDRDPQTGEPVHTRLSGLALMVFFVYACQCMSTVAVVRRETRGWKWPLFMFGSMTAVAYVAALLVFQVGGLF
jgi:ferrous iron transport protein B